MVIEALSMKDRIERRQDQKDQERSAWRKEKNPELEKLR